MVNPLNAPTSDDKLWAGLSYVGIICCMIGTIVVFFLKKDESSFIKFNALQALGFGLGYIVISILVGIVSSIIGSIPIIGAIIGLIAPALMTLAFLACWLFLIIQAFRGVEVRLPVLADFIDQNLMG